MSEAKRVRTVIALFLAIGPVAAISLAQLQNISQAPRPTFEAASVKPDNCGLGPQTRILPGRLAVACASLRDLIAFAYGLRTDQITEGPSWIASDRYAIEATTAGNTPGSHIAGTMLQALLEDRFKLVVHRETRQLPVYELTVLRNGLKLQPTKEGSCTPFSRDSPPLPPAPGTTRLPFCGFPRSGRSGSTWTLEGQGIRMGALAESLSRLQVGRSVIDKTGMPGTYDVHLKWTADPAPPDNPGAPPAVDDLSEPFLFTAVREQLGLRIESAKGPVEVVVIDHAERPTEN
jgi:uncharacterized protein (TIGR03435 family)